MERPAVPVLNTARPLDAQRIQRRARWVLWLIPLLVLGLVGWTAWARGWLDRHETFQLVTPNAKGLSPRTPVTFAGLPVGEVVNMTVQDDGRVQVAVRIKAEDVRWVRADATFSVERSLLGAASIRLTPGPSDAPADPLKVFELGGAEQELDVAALGERVNRILAQVEAALQPEAALQQSLRETQALLAKANGGHGLLHVLTGSPAQAQAILQVVEGLGQTSRQATTLLQQLGQVVARTDAKVNDPGGVLDEATRTAQDLQALLTRSTELVQSLQPLIETLQQGAGEANTILHNVQPATADLGRLRQEVESSLRQLQDMTRQLQQRWPLATDRTLKLP
jgi:phospholipid/cholesterol/gamma-HCH transport system substrate-binding protein